MHIVFQTHQMRVHVLLNLREVTADDLNEFGW